MFKSLKRDTLITNNTKVNVTALVQVQKNNNNCVKH